MRADAEELIANAYTFAVGPMRPSSRGRLSLASADPRRRPVIDLGYLDERHDLETLVAGVRKALELRTQPAFGQ